MRNPAIALLLLAIAAPATAIDTARARALLEGACREAASLPSRADFRARIASLENEAAERSVLDEFLARLTVRMAKRYAAGELNANEGSVAACVAENAIAKIDILMLDDPAHHRDTARRE